MQKYNTQNTMDDWAATQWSCSAIFATPTRVEPWANPARFCAWDAQTKASAAVYSMRLAADGPSRGLQVWLVGR